MIAFFTFLSLQAAVISPDCNRTAIESKNLQFLQGISGRLDKLTQERRELIAKRSELAKRSVKSAEMGSLKRGLAEEFGQSQEDLERRDVAYTARINTIAEEAKGIISVRDEKEVRYKAELNQCGMTQ